MDSNNFRGAAGMGEREARCGSSLVARRHFGLAHGIGRSGNIRDEQPKAAGSTLIARLTHCLVKDALSIAGLQDIGDVTVLPVATGMALTLSLLALRAKRPPEARYVIWSRIDQKTCLKSVQAAGLKLLVIEPTLEGDELHTDIAAMQREVESRGADSVVCVMTTTSCFAPRAADNVEDVARLCQQLQVGHIINNAYGVQSSAMCTAITRAWRRGRVDAVVQSTDKNFLVPVGGSVVTAGKCDSSLVQAVSESYPGRASLSPLLDVFITLLSLGASGWQNALEEREALYPYLHQRLEGVAAAHGERVLSSPLNPISIAISLSSLERTLCTACQASPPVTVAAEAAAAIDRADGTNEKEQFVADPRRTEAAITQVDDERGANKQGGREQGATKQRTVEQRANEQGAKEERAKDQGANEQRTKEWGAHEQSTKVRGTNEQGAQEHGAAVGEACVDPGLAPIASDSKGGAREREAGTAPSLPSKPLTFLGSMLFSRLVSGCRVIALGEEKTVAGVKLANFGSSHSKYPHPYLTAAAALGGSKAEVDLFVRRLDACLTEFRCSNTPEACVRCGASFVDAKKE